MDSLGSYGNMPLYLTRFISRAKLSVKTVQLLRLPLTSDAACLPASPAAPRCERDHDAGTGVREKWLCAPGGELIRRNRMLGGQPCGVTRSEGDGAIGRYHVLDVAFRGSL